MPTRGYRKGISDAGRPRPHVIKARIGATTYDGLHAEADDRSMTFSALVDRVLEAHVGRHRVELPHPQGLTPEALRQFARAGNNLNQIAHQANAMQLHMIEDRAEAAIAVIVEAARRLVT